MARPGLAVRRRDEFEAERPEYPMRYRPDPAQIQRPTLPARIGAGTRPRRPAKRSDGLVLWRVLGVSAAVLILGMGGVLAYNLVAPTNGNAARTAAQSASGAAPAASAPLPSASAAASATPGSAPVQSASGTAQAAPAPATLPSASAQPRRIGDAGHSQTALKVASILGSGGEALPQPIGEAGPTAADFARPAFLEPIADASDDDTLSTGAVGAVAERTPDAAVPLPAPRPVRLASADTAADDDAGSARIRSAVTLRSGPRRSASAIGTLDAGAKVKIYSCKSWCEVSSGAKRGWVYKSSVAR